MRSICVEQADEVASTLDKLIKQGKIPKDGIPILWVLKKIFYKFTSHLQNMRGIPRLLNSLKHWSG